MMESTEEKLVFVSWNTCGVRNTLDFPSKSEDIPKELERLRADIAFLQETHIGPKGIDILARFKDWHSFFTVYHTRSKGVAILIRKRKGAKEREKPTYHYEDSEGSYIVHVCKIDDKYFTLVNVYNHAKDKTVLQRVTQCLQENAKGILVIGGDFNAILHYDFDRNYPTGHQEPLRPFLEEFISSLHLMDVWGQLNPIGRAFTFFSGKLIRGQTTCARATLKTSPKKRKMPPKSYTTKRKKQSESRLDMFFIPWNAMHYVQKCTISRSKISDHDPVILEINLRSTGGTDELIKSLGDCPPVTLKDMQERDEYKDSGEISGAEVQVAIKSQMVCKDIIFANQENNWATITNSLTCRFKFNEMIRGHQKSIDTFSMEYLILTTILANRLGVYLRPSFKTRTQKTKFKLFTMVAFRTVPKTINWPFLKSALLKLKELKRINPVPQYNFSILGTLLPSHEGKKKLQKNSPLTSAILTLSLKWLANHLKPLLEECEVDVCAHRQCMVVYMHPRMYKTLTRELSTFKTLSDIDLIPHVGRTWYRRQAFPEDNQQLDVSEFCSAER